MKSLEIMVCTVKILIFSDFDKLKNLKELEEKTHQSFFSYCVKEGRYRRLKSISFKTINSTIKGYDVYHLRPRKSIKMQVKIEQDNEFDQFAMLVEIPPTIVIDTGIRAS